MGLAEYQALLLSYLELSIDERILKSIAMIDRLFMNKVKDIPNIDMSFLGLGGSSSNIRGSLVVDYCGVQFEFHYVFTDLTKNVTIYAEGKRFQVSCGGNVPLFFIDCRELTDQELELTLIEVLCL